MNVGRRPLFAGAGAFGALALAAYLGLVPLPWGPSGPIRHQDGQGPLGSTLDPNGFTSSQIAPGSDTETFGYPLCVKDPADPATIDSVEPLTVVGTGIRYVGAGIRYIPESLTKSGAMLITAHPFPPNVDPPMVNALGAEVHTSCAHRLSPYTEFDLGLGRVGSAGGAWLGFQIHYHARGRDYILVLHDESILCGPDIAQLCSPASDTAAPAS